MVSCWTRWRASKSSEYVLEGRIIAFVCSSQSLDRAGSEVGGSEGDEVASIEVVVHSDEDVYIGTVQLRSV